MKILVAEDSLLMRRILVDSLQQWDYEVVEAENGAEAWEQFQRDQFPLVLTDWMMPEMDGLELTERIRASAFGRLHLHHPAHRKDGEGALGPRDGGRGG